MVPELFHYLPRSSFAGLLMMVFTSAVCASEVSTHFNLTEVASGVYVHKGRHVTPEQPGRDDIANIGFIVGGECVAVIDTGGSVATGRRLRESIRTVTDLPICYVINTHIHYDHLLGNAAFRDGNTRFIGHEALAGSVTQNRAFFVREYGEELGARGGDAVIAPDQGVSDTLTLELGQRQLTLRAHGPAHTFTDLSVYDPKTGTLWLSDLLFVNHIPVLDGKLKGWLGVLEGLEKLPADTAVPGHGPASVPWPGATGAMRRYLETLRDRVRGMIAEGRFMEEVLDNAAREEARGWRLHDYYHRRNVSKAFTELEWE